MPYAGTSVNAVHAATVAADVNALIRTPNAVRTNSAARVSAALENGMPVKLSHTATPAKAVAATGSETMM